MRRTQDGETLPGDGSALRRNGQRPTEPCERLILGLLAHMPMAEAQRFDAGHVAALRAAARHLQWGRHPLDVRLSLPLGSRRLYLTLIGGVDRRALTERGHGLVGASLAFMVLLVVALGWRGLG
jgi:hypothetical protein